MSRVPLHLQEEAAAILKHGYDTIIPPDVGGRATGKTFRVLAGAALLASTGERVMILVGSHKEARYMAHSFMDMFGAQFIGENLNMKIRGDTDGGHVIIRSINAELRGYKGDTLLVDMKTQ